MRTFNLRDWEQRLGMNRVDVLRFGGGTAVNPRSVVATEIIRRTAAQYGDVGASVPADVFVIAKGEPEDRSCVKFGGLPARPRGLQWPYTDEGVAFRFVGQFCFRDSLDLVPTLPGDLLLVFTADEPPYTDDQSCIHCEWHDVGTHELVTATDIPYDWSARPAFYGERHRTCDLIEPQRIRQVLRESLPEVAEWDPEEIAALGIWSGIKIGGRAPCVRGTDSTEIVGDSFLCCFSDIGCWPGIEYPWLNVRKPLSSRESLTGNQQFLWYDGFVLKIYISDNQAVTWALDLA